MGPYSSVVGNSVHLIAPEGHFAGQVMIIGQDDRLREKDAQQRLLQVIHDLLNSRIDLSALAAQPAVDAGPTLAEMIGWHVDADNLHASAAPSTPAEVEGLGGQALYDLLYSFVSDDGLTRALRMELNRRFPTALTALQARAEKAEADLAEARDERDVIAAAAFEKVARAAEARVWSVGLAGHEIRALTPDDATAALAEHVQRAVEAETRACAAKCTRGDDRAAILARLDQPKGGEGKV
ncbi:hypothetical protein JCM7686_2902 [Paracoccus aminophilus JCM 7686]|uniref:Uncharacterized protein n=2 Tax=Paracoccus aminophilus TaxID=34003 RepID=S5YEQ2_PARAH|nr:hypothetical protein JCM7686_2902 [Paracoccus aminophilus JCM 7686]